MQAAGFIPYIFVFLFGVLMASVAQIVLKKEAGKEHKNFFAEYLNPRVIIGYGIMVGSTLMTLISFRGGVPMNWAPILESMGYVFVTILGVVLLKERVTPGKWGALAVILAGVVMFALG